MTTKKDDCSDRLMKLCYDMSTSENTFEKYEVFEIEKITERPFTKESLGAEEKRWMQYMDF